MRSLIVALALLATSMPGWTADAADTVETRKAAAERYLKATDMGALIESGLEAGIQTLSPDQRREFMEIARRHIRIDALEALALAAMVKNFTTRELDALASFYGSPEGRSAMAKMGNYMADVMPIVQAEMERVGREIQAEYESKRVPHGGT